jgi:hypothetical protein
MTDFPLVMPAGERTDRISAAGPTTAPNLCASMMSAAKCGDGDVRYSCKNFTLALL